MLILIAEDDELILKTIEHKLLKEGHEVILTRNGKDAIETLKTRDVDLANRYYDAVCLRN